MAPQQTISADPISSLLASADVTMNLALEAFGHSHQPQELLKVVKEYSPKVGQARETLYTNADLALRALVAARVNYADAEHRVSAVVAICNSFLEWACRYIGQSPLLAPLKSEPSKPEGSETSKPEGPEPSKPEGSEPPNIRAILKWTGQQAKLMKEQQAFYSAYQVVRGDLLRMWEVMANQAPPDPQTHPIPNERTEQPTIEALFKLGAIGLEGLQSLPANKRPTGERLALAAIGRACDGQFKATLAHMIDLGWLGNGRDHGLSGGYFLTPAGKAFAKKPR